ncbi:VOC family protein [Ramlibacter tataouinensis]|uniref:VOC family protein n=1 Tax=Ramlibacter tataouinensis TaxID=94132 RepID=UPI0022F3CC66|nr:VOC family protein [Ramlibacter tataouinensis]WBY01396.1 VOC family protein [Ramlibacter tataouinensis]
MPTLDCYIFFDGQCAEAMRFYERTLGGRMETFMTYAQSPQPEHCPPGSADRIMHASLLLEGERRLMASDSPAGQHKAAMAGFGLALNYPTAQEAQRIFAALSAGGSVTMPMSKTFWTEAFGMCSDRFGTPWMVSGGAQAG